MPNAEHPEASFRALIESLPDGVVVHRDGLMVYVNAAARRLLGYLPDDRLVGRSVLDIVHADYHSLVRERVGRVVASHEAQPPVEERLLAKDGTLVAAEIVAIPTHFGGQPAVLALARDLTARREMEAHLVMADRFASIGRLAASVGHEINNPLAYLLGNVTLMRRELTAVREVLPAQRFDDLVEKLAIIEEGATRVRDIVRDLKTLSRSEEEPKIPVDLHGVLDVSINLAQHELGARARLVRTYGPEAYVLASEARLGQVFLNLVLNAAQAIPDGEDASEHEVSVSTYLASGNVVVEVCDTGVGIAEDVRARIFEPFFTTKAKGAGIGVGLAICHHIVSSLGGAIGVERRTPRGTCFRVVLPVTREHGDSPAPPKAPTSTPSAKRRILVVDDEPALTRTIVRQLEDWDVRVAGSAAEAIAILKGGAAFDAFLVDLNMPAESGSAVFDWLRRQRVGEERRVVFMSGGAFDEPGRAFLRDNACEQLEKPFGVEELVAALARVSGG